MKLLILLFALNAHALEFCDYVDDPCDAEGHHYSCFHAWAEGSYCSATDVTTYGPHRAAPDATPVVVSRSLEVTPVAADATDVNACRAACDSVRDQWGYRACLNSCR